MRFLVCRTSRAVPEQIAAGRPRTLPGSSSSRLANSPCRETGRGCSRCAAAAGGTRLLLPDGDRAVSQVRAKNGADAVGAGPGRAIAALGDGEGDDLALAAVGGE